MSPARFFPPTKNLSSPVRHFRAPRPCHGAVLLEVILALVLFVAAAAVISSALSTSVESVLKQKTRLQASNLAITIASEIQMGIRPSVPGGPTPFEKPLQDWTYQLVVATAEVQAEGISPPSRIEVVVRHPESETTYRLTTWVNPVEVAPPLGSPDPNSNFSPPP